MAEAMAQEYRQEARRVMESVRKVLDAAELPAETLKALHAALDREDNG